MILTRKGEVKKMEDKQEILDKLLPAVQLTIAGNNIEELTYNRESEIVEIRFRNGGTRKANVRMHSGIAMIRDVLRKI